MGTTSQTIYQIDAFTRQPFKGNPAAVCLLNQPASDTWMRSIAAEMNLSETAFLVRQEEAFNLRWFTPLKEVRLCGHATLASAHILWETGVVRNHEQIRFTTLSGLLTADQCNDWIEMDFPARSDEACEPPEGLLEALSIAPLHVAPLHIAPLHVGINNQTYLIEVPDANTVRELTPDFSRLGKLPVRSVIITARSDSLDYDFVSRYFAPAIGVNEDPVTGSAHCRLAPYWAARLGKTEMTGYQASPRGGVVRVRLAGERVILCGQAVTVMVGELKAEPV